jgi:hypothetical protein
LKLYKRFVELKAIERAHRAEIEASIMNIDLTKPVDETPIMVDKEYAQLRRTLIKFNYLLTKEEKDRFNLYKTISIRRN